MHRPRLRSIIWLAIIACTSDLAAVTHDLSPYHDDARVLENPHKGWYHHHFDNGTWGYGVGSDADLDDFPGMDHLYLRIAWSYLEAEGDDRYDWSLIDDAVAKWVPKGYRIAIRITAKETGTHPGTVGQLVGGVHYATPKWVRDRGAGGVVVDNWGSLHWEPDWDDPVYMEAMADFQRDFAARYDGQPWLAYVDVGTIGDWGEGHTGFSSGVTPSVATCKAHMDVFAAAFSRTLVVVTDDFLYFQKSSSQADELLAHARSKGFSVRDDSVLVDWYMQQNTNSFSVSHPRFFSSTYREVPTILEAQHYHLVQNDGNWQGANGEQVLSAYGMSGADFLRGAIDTMHATWIGYHGSASDWLSDNPDLARELANRCGYRYTIDSASMPSRATAGSRQTVSIRWTNRGVAPAYHRYALQVRLVGPATDILTIDDAGNRSWMDGATATVDYALDLPASLPAGDYEVRVKLADLDDTGRDVDLALDTGIRDGQGFFTLGSLTIDGGGGTPTRAIAVQVRQASSAVDLAVTLSPGGAVLTGTDHRFAGLDPSAVHGLSFAQTAVAMVDGGRALAALAVDRGCGRRGRAAVVRGP